MVEDVIETDTATVDEYQGWRARNGAGQVRKVGEDGVASAAATGMPCLMRSRKSIRVSGRPYFFLLATSDAMHEE